MCNPFKLQLQVSLLICVESFFLKSLRVLTQHHFYHFAEFPEKHVRAESVCSQTNCKRNMKKLFPRTVDETFLRIRARYSFQNAIQLIIGVKIKFKYSSRGDPLSSFFPSHYF